MKNEYFCRYFFAPGASYEHAVQQLIAMLCGANDYTILRLVFFSEAQSNAQYRQQVQTACRNVRQQFGESSPLVVCVAQKPMHEQNVVLEVHYRRVRADQHVSYKCFGDCRYITIEGPGVIKELYVAAMNCDDNLHIAEQARLVFHCLSEIFTAENMPIRTIVRQWNYIERITAVSSGYQHYQALNDARAEFYDGGRWHSDFPAATGIGTDFGGILVDINAAQGLVTRAIDNRVQVAAYSYSESVLMAGGRGKSATPKFERARSVIYGNDPMIYISGTAAIRGELSLSNRNIGVQALITIENIAELICSDNLQYIALPERQFGVDSARVYVKNGQNGEQALRIAHREFSMADIVCLRSDVCRAELEVEIEAIAHVVVNG